jgi:hypothetical protein
LQLSHIPSASASLLPSTKHFSASSSLLQVRLQFPIHTININTMPSFTKSLITLLLTTTALALPTPQLAGEGAALNSIFSSTDNGIGYGIKNAEQNLANNVAQLKGSTGGAGATTGSGAAPPPPPPGPGPHRRQLDKISDGFQTLSSAAGMGDSTKALTNGLDEIDGSSTSGAANLGAEMGSLEESTLESLGNAVPRA